MKYRYTALYVDNPEKLLGIFSPKHEKVYGLHSTIAFKPESVENLEVGKKVSLKIIGRVFDDRGDALLVENKKSKNKNPHITISCSKDTDPVYSNDLLEKASLDGDIEYFDKEYFIETTEGYEGSDGKMVLK